MRSPFQIGGDVTPPLQSDEFKETIIEQYAAQADGVGFDACIGAAVDEIWPAPEYRPHQREAVVEIIKELYVNDNSAVTLSAPTGAGKSLIIYAVVATIDNVFNRDSFITTPLNSLIDQINADEFIGDDVLTIKGMSNYQCKHRMDRGASVDNAICQRVDDFDCQYKKQPHTSGGCDYYGRKESAKHTAELTTNIAYLMANSMIPETVDGRLDPRELVLIDECQSIEDFALQFIGVVVSDNTVPVVYDDISIPPSTDDATEMVDWLSNDVQPLVAEKLDEYEMIVELTEQQSDNQEDLQQFSRKVSNLIEDVENNHWTVNTEDEDDGFKVEFEPIHIGRFLDSFLWSQGHKAVLSSATIPKHDFMKELGLPSGDVANVEVESTFDPHRRPIYTDCTVGKMTMAERDTTLPKMADKIADIADYHNEGNPHRGFVHCHSYAIMEKLYELLPANVRRRTRCQDEDNREQSLEDWLNADVDDGGLGKNEGGQVFLSVGMAEGISLDDWQTRWQVIAKAAHPYAGPEAKRTNYRVNELNEWDWYFGSAAIDMQQAIGRGMRSESDWCFTYLLDESCVELLKDKQHLIEDYVLEAVDVTVADELPDGYK